MSKNRILDKKILLDQKKLFSVEVGKEICRLRKKRGLTEKVLASYLGVSQQQLSRYERGICAIKLDYLMILLHFLEVPVDSFFNRVLSNVFDENNEIAYRYYNIFFSLRE